MNSCHRLAARLGQVSRCYPYGPPQSMDDPSLLDPQKTCAYILSGARILILESIMYIICVCRYIYIIHIHIYIYVYMYICIYLYMYM